MAADRIVKAVMISLAFASVVTWSVWLAKVIELLSARRNLLRDLHTVEQSRSLERFLRYELPEPPERDIALLARAAVGEDCGDRTTTMNHDGVKGRAASIFSPVSRPRRTRRAFRASTGILATIRIDRSVRAGRPVRDGVGHHELVHRHL